MPLFKRKSSASLSSWVQELCSCDPERGNLLKHRPLSEQNILGAFFCGIEEVEKIVRPTSHSSLLQIKIQWWIDLLEKETSPLPEGHPLTKALAFLEKTVFLKRSPFASILMAYEEKSTLIDVSSTSSEFLKPYQSIADALTPLLLQCLYSIIPLSPETPLKKKITLYTATHSLITLWEVAHDLRLLIPYWTSSRQLMPMSFLQDQGLDPLKPVDYFLKHHPPLFASAFRCFVTDVLKQPEGKLIRQITFPEEVIFLEKMRQRLLFIFMVLRQAKRLPLSLDAFNPPWFFRFMA
jgi:hypothetical protein